MQAWEGRRAGCAYVMRVQEVQPARDVQRDLVAAVVPLQLPEVVGGNGSAQVTACTVA